jgi:hypothetical protein
MHCLPQWDYGNDIVGPKILALPTRCYKNIIAYNKAHGILAVTKHVELKRASLFKSFKEIQHGCPRIIWN